MKRPYFKKTDLLPVFAALTVAAVGVIFLISNQFNNDTAAIAEIRVNSEVVKVIELKNVSEAYEISVNGSCKVTLEVSKDGVRFTESQCSDKLCVHSGLIKADESAACLPAGVSVTVRGSNSSDVDGVVG